MDRVTRDGLELHHPLGSAVRNGVLYTVDVGYVRSLIWLRVNHSSRLKPGSTILNGIAVTEDGTVYTSTPAIPS